MLRAVRMRERRSAFVCYARRGERDVIRYGHTRCYATLMPLRAYDIYAMMLRRAAAALRRACCLRAAMITPLINA